MPLNAMDADVSIEQEVRAFHNYLEVAYNTQPYEGMEVRELLEFSEQYDIRQPLNQELLTNNEVDKNWIILCDIDQSLARKNSLATEYAKTAFMLRKSAIREGGQDGFLIDGRTDHLFYNWKECAWVNPEDAEALAYTLQNGYKGRIPVNLEWAEFWLRRAKLLRRAGGHWWMPEDTAQERYDPKYDINTIYNSLRGEIYAPY